MADAIAARQHGDDYQAYLFWKEVCSLLANRGIARVGFEVDSFRAFDDVAVEYSTPRADGHGGQVDSDHWQVKFSVTFGKELTCHALTDPATIRERAGLTEMIRVGPKEAATLVIRRFLRFTGEVIVEPKWGTVITSPEQGLVGVWIRLGNVPCKPPYEVPATWGGLFDVCPNLEAQLKQVVRHIRDGDDKLLVVGFSFPTRVGGPDMQIHWQPIWLPAVSYKDNYANGFRANEQGYWIRDRQNLFHNSQRIMWERSENWNRSQPTTRGAFDRLLSDKPVLLIGCGALGSVIAEILVRGGLRRLVLCDGDEMQQTNLCRHVLDLSSLKAEKSRALANRLNRTNPHALVSAIGQPFPSSDERHVQLTLNCDVVVDCSGVDSVLRDLNNMQWNNEKLFISVSLSYGARRLYCFASRGRTFSVEGFNAAVRPWLLKDAEEHLGTELPPEGIGCWHPAFPARIDQVWAWAGIAASVIEKAVVSPPTVAKLTVFERGVDESTGTIQPVTL